MKTYKGQSEVFVVAVVAFICFTILLIALLLGVR